MDQPIYEKISDPENFFNWLRDTIEADPNTKFEGRRLLLILDIIGVTGMLNGIKNLSEDYRDEALQILQKSIFADLDYALGVIDRLLLIPGVDISFQGSNGDRIDIVGDPVSILFLSIVLKKSHIGRNVRMMLLKEGTEQDDDWIYNEETIGPKTVPNFILNKIVMDGMGKADSFYSSTNILFSPKLEPIIELLFKHQIVDKAGQPFGSLVYIFSDIYKHINEMLPRLEVCPAITVIVKSESVNTQVAHNLVGDTQEVEISCDTDKGLVWMTFMGAEDPTEIVRKALEIVKKSKDIQIFITANSYIVCAYLRQGSVICIDTYATTHVAKTIKYQKFPPGVYLFNTNVPLLPELKRTSLINHLHEPLEMYTYQPEEG